MGKSILVMDKPECCTKCRMFSDAYTDMTCRGNGRTIDYPYPDNKIQDWCPLQDMPDMGSAVLIQLKSERDGITGDEDRTFDISYIRSSDNSEWFCSTGEYPLKAIKAWKPIKSYHES